MNHRVIVALANVWPGDTIYINAGARVVKTAAKYVYHKGELELRRLKHGYLIWRKA